MWFISLIIGTMFIGTLTQSFTTPYHQHEGQDNEEIRSERALPFLHISTKLTAGGAKAAAYCAEKPMCCAAEVKTLWDSLWKFFNPFGRRSEEYNSQKRELARSRRAAPLIPIVLALAKKGAVAAAEFCLAEVICCVSNLSEMADVFQKALEYLNPLNIIG